MIMMMFSRNVVGCTSCSGAQHALSILVGTNNLSFSSMVLPLIRHTLRAHNSFVILMSSPSSSLLQRAEVFSLFRHIFRLARKMKHNSLKEAEYITSECKNRFRENRFLKDHAHVQKAIDYAKTRIYMCENYGIAYERMANVTSSGGGDVKIVHEGLREEVGNFESVGLPKNVTAEEARRKAREKRRRMSESLEESRSRTSGSGGSSST